MPHIDDLLPDEGEVETQQQVVRLVDRARGGVFDRQHRPIDVTLDHGLEHRPERRVGLEADRPARDGKVLERSLVAIGALGALERHRDFLLDVRLAGLQRVVLAANRVVQDFAEDAAHERRIEPQSLAHRGTMLQQRRFAIGIAHRPVALGLDPGNLSRQPGALAQGRHEHGIDVVQALP